MLCVKSGVISRYLVCFDSAEFKLYRSMYNSTSTVLNENVCLCAQVSMFNDEIFIIGKPPILLHSKDSGKSWERVPLSPKVSGLLVVSTVDSSILLWSVADTGRVDFVRWDTLKLSIACYLVCFSRYKLSRRRRSLAWATAGGSHWEGTRSTKARQIDNPDERHLKTLEEGICLT